MPPAFPPAPLLRLPGCVLRPYHVADAAAMCALADDPDVARQMRDRFPHPYTAADAAEWLRIVHAEGLEEEERKEEEEEGGKVTSGAGGPPKTSRDAIPELYLVIGLPDGTFAGAIGLHRVGTDGTDRYTREIGYWVGRPYAGRGLATAAARGLARWALGVARDDTRDDTRVAAAAAAEPGTTTPATTAANHFPVLQRLEANVYAANAASRRVLRRAGFVEEGVRRRAAFKYGVPTDVVMLGLVASDLADGAGDGTPPLRPPVADSTTTTAAA
ncbi:acetyltransferase [Niveomyces insectorum RCEF 264]|uniref:Acetyltransferase n=1 Tax=Niveomyces insectorum RCEF 264 TaxID=1081102 RepID=A0A167VGP5_9HYPO|nr:acetyltransferase [Niveomyces insectorum RCEF 264]